MTDKTQAGAGEPKPQRYRLARTVLTGQWALTIAGTECIDLDTYVSSRDYDRLHAQLEAVTRERDELVDWDVRTFWATVREIGLNIAHEDGWVMMTRESAEAAEQRARDVREECAKKCDEFAKVHPAAFLCAQAIRDGER